MKKKWLPIVAFMAGLLLIGISIFANKIGLTHSASWGARRILLMAVGILILLISLFLSERMRLGQDPKALSGGGLSYLTMFFCAALVISVYVWLISVGQWTTWPPTTNYYDRLAVAFKEGHLYLDNKPDPALLALPDPYEPDARKSIQGLDEIWDMTLYNGKVYIYWGPSPAVLLTALKFFYPRVVGDQILVFAFISGLFIFQFLLLLRVWRRHFKDLPAWAVLTGVFLAAFVNPIPWILCIPRIYEAAIASDQFFFIGGLYFAFAALDREKYSLWRLIVAGTLWAFAIGSRVTIAPPILFIAAMALLWILKSRSGERPIAEAIRAASGLGIPLLAAAIGLGWYNWARFGSIFEFGFRYAITMLNQNKYYNVLFFPRYIFPNLYMYLINPPVFRGTFPFIKPVWNGDFISSFNNQYHTIYNAELMIGLIYSVPFLFFALVPIVMLIYGARKKKPELNPLDVEEKNRFWNWFLLTVIGASLLALLTVLLVFYATMRYFVDVMPILTLLSIFGFWQGYTLAAERPALRRWVAIIAISLAIISIVIGILLAFSSDVDRIRSNNPALLRNLSLFFVHLLSLPVK